MTNVVDILNYYKDIKFKKRKQIVPKEEKIKISEDLKKIYDCIRKETLDINQISRICKMSIQDVSYKLLLLQIEDFIEELPGQRFKIK